MQVVNWVSHIITCSMDQRLKLRAVQNATLANDGGNKQFCCFLPKLASSYKLKNSEYA